MSGQTARTRSLLSERWLTALESAQQGGCMALSQRVGEMRREGLTVLDKWVETPAGARVKAYRWIPAGCQVLL
jgi:hypothetical protein